MYIISLAASSAERPARRPLRGWLQRLSIHLLAPVRQERVSLVIRRTACLLMYTVWHSA
jgi:hypothetical protein